MPVSLAALWLPIAVCAVAVFVASLVVCMAVPIHKNDWGRLPNEDALLDFVRAQKPAAGQYMFPCTPPEMQDPAMKERCDRGPWGTVHVFAGPYHMGRVTAMWFLHQLIVAIFVGYVAHLGLGAKEPFLHVFRLTSAMAWIAHAGGALPSAIWEGKPMNVALKTIFYDALICALVTGAIFGWLWPHGA